MDISTIIIIIVAAVVLLILLSLINKVPARCVDKLHFQNEWNDALALMNDPRTRPMSVIHADKLLDQALKCCGYKGDTMGERLISAKHSLKDRNNVWTAHKLRNKLVHESMNEPSEKQVQQAMKAYRQAFKDLGVF